MAVSNKLGATFLCIWYIAVGGWSSSAMVRANASLPDCSPVLIKLQGCLQYVTGKAATPSDSCCSAVLNVHRTKPVCLCVMAMDDTTTRIIPNYRFDLAGQLPTLCNIEGASLNNCPALLGETNATAPASSPGASAPATQSPGGVYRLTMSANLYLGLILGASALISFIKY